MPGRRGREAMPGRWASPYWASHQTRLGRAIKRGWASQDKGAVGRAIKQGWGKPSNEVGRASTKGPLGEPVLIGRARTHWASPYSLGLGEPVLGEPLNHFHSGQRLEAVVGGHRGQRGVVGRGDGTPSSTSKTDWSALLERPVVSELCSCLPAPARCCPALRPALR